MSVVEITKVGGVTVVRIIKEKILTKDVISQFGDELSSIKEEDGRKVAVDFSRSEFLSSAALNKLILFDRQVKKFGGHLRLFGLQSQVWEIFTITRLRQMFKIDDSEADALQRI
jgi:anti-anti-sigma factor